MIDFNNITGDQIRYLRKRKTLKAGAKAKLLAGCLEQGVYIQFHEDLRFGFWNAILCAQHYEESGKYTKGTCLNVLQAQCPKS